MDLTLPQDISQELSAALLQAAVTAFLAVLLWAAYRRSGKAYLRWWCVAWTLYVVRMGAILAFFLTEWAGWLMWHQVLTGWTALAILGAALAFARPTASRTWLRYAAIFPLVWSYVAIYQIQDFLLAAGPAVVFLSLATMWAAVVFGAQYRRVGSLAAGFLAITLALWALHHLDYPFLRARGAWVPWGYYLDILFEGATGFGILILALEDLRSGLETLSALTDRVQRSAPTELIAALLAEIGRVPGVRGAALVERVGETYRVGESVGALAGDDGGLAEQLSGAVMDPAVPSVLAVDRGGGGHVGGGLTWLPVRRSDGTTRGVVVEGDARHGLLALEDRYLLAIGDQVGIALDKADLQSHLVARTGELESLAALTVRQHEAERHRLSRELHDETAQALAAVRMRLGLLREEFGADAAPLVDGASEALKDAIGSIRKVTSRLRPLVLDELGLVPALRALARDFEEGGGVAVSFEVAEESGRLDPDQELTLYRALQEALSNVARHAGASSVRVSVTRSAASIDLVVDDDGVGINGGDATAPGGLAGGATGGLAGMTERVESLGGELELRDTGQGTQVLVRLPAPADADAPRPEGPGSSAVRPGGGEGG